MNKKIMFVAIFTIILLCGCSSKKRPAGEIVSESYGKGYDNWQEAYATYIEETDSNDRKLQYSLICLDEDDIPELYVEGCCSADGEQVLTFHENELNILYLSRLGSEHIPEKGLIYNNCGHMDYYPIYVYKLFAGDFYIIGEGIWGGLDWSDGIKLNEKGEPDYQFEWEGKRYSEEEFYEEIDKVFPLEEGVRPSEWYEGDEILELMSFGS